MKKFTLPVKKTAILSLFLGLCLQQSYGQLAAGTYTVGNGYTYTNLAAVATALSNGVSGNVVFELQTNYTEAPSSPVTFTSWTGNATFTVTIRPAATVVSMLFTAGNPGTNSPLLNLSAAQNMILDGRPGGSGTAIMWTIQNTSTSSAGPAIEMTAGADNDTLEYLGIESSNPAQTSGTVFLYCSSTGPNNTGDVIQNCDIGPNGTTYPANALCAFGYGPGFGSTPLYSNNYISVLNNTIHDFFSSFVTTGCGIIVTGTGLNTDYGDHWTISGNSFFRTVNNNLGDYMLIVINFIPSPNYASAASAGNTISNNYIGGSASALAGGAISGTWVTAANPSNQPAFQGITVNAMSASITGNVIGGIFDLMVAEQSGFTGIYVPSGSSSGTFTISGNTIGSTYGAGNIYWGTSSSAIAFGTGSKTLTTQAGLGYRVGDTVRIANAAFLSVNYCWYMEGNVTAYNPATGSLTVNVVRTLGTGTGITEWNITLANGVQTSGQWMMDGIWVGETNMGTCSITNNIIGNLTNTNSNSFTTSGIIAQNGAYTITGNTIYNLSNECVSSTSQLYVGVDGSVVGISDQSIESSVQTVSGNSIYNLYSLYSGNASNNITGIELNGVTSAVYTHLANANFVYNLSAPNSAVATHICGIITYSGTYELTNNMIRLGLIDSASASITGSLDIEGIADQNAGSGSSGTQKIYHNTVYISGAGVAGGTTNTYCYRRNNENFSPKDIIDVRNNIFVNNRSNAAGTAGHFGIGLDNNSTVTSDYNDIYGTGTGYGFGLVNATAYPTKAAWNTANAAFDVNSKNADPLLLSPASATPDFHLTAGTPCDAVAGATALYPTDYYNFIRANYTPVDLGAVVYGTTNGPPPQSAFSSADTTFCANNCISFSDLSSNNPTAWQWTFAGGYPSSSTVQNPPGICYFNSGNYSVTLIATNAGGTDTLKMNNFINVISAPPTPVIRESNDTLYCSLDSSYISFQWYLDSVLISGATDSFLVVSQGGNYNVLVANANGCKTSAGDNIILGIANPDLSRVNDGIVSLYPNPAWNQLRINSGWLSVEKIEIYSVLGEHILDLPMKTQNNGGEMVIDVSALPAGIYFVRVESKDNSKMAKFIKASSIY